MRPWLLACLMSLGAGTAQGAVLTESFANGIVAVDDQSGVISRCLATVGRTIDQNGRPIIRIMGDCVRLGQMSPGRLVGNVSLRVSNGVAFVTNRDSGQVMMCSPMSTGTGRDCVEGAIK